MSFIGALLGAPWKTITNYLYVASHWDTISHDLEMYRAEIRDRDEWITAIKARHREQEETLRQQIQEWAFRADRTLALAEGTVAKLEEAARLLGGTRQQYFSLVGNYIDAAVLLSVNLRWASPARQDQALSLLEPDARAVIETAMAMLPDPGSADQFAFASLRDTIIPLVLRLNAPPDEPRL